MIKTLEKTARTEDEAVALALAELKLDRDDVSVEILARAKSGFLGIGASPAVVKVSYECPDEPEIAPKKNPEPKPEKKPEKKAEKKPEKKAEKKPEPIKPAEPAPVIDESPEFAEIRRFLTGLLERMGVKAEINISAREGGGVNVDLSGDGMGAIIGRRGETLDAIQHLTNYVINKGNDKRHHINVDAEQYRSKREDSLCRLAEKMAEKAIRYKRNMALEPMNSYERHVIHTALQNYEGVTTASTGEEPNRRVVVQYVRSDNDRPAAAQSSGSKPKSREWA